MRPLLTLLLCAAPLAAEDGREPPARLDTNFMVRPVGSLDLDWRRPAPAPWIGFRQAEERYQQNAVTIRFGAPTKGSPSKIEVQVGNFLQKALFVAAVIVTFVL